MKVDVLKEVEKAVKKNDILTRAMASGLITADQKRELNAILIAHVQLLINPPVEPEAAAPAGPEKPEKKNKKK